MSVENENSVSKPKQRRGFASMSPEKQRAIASKGGKRSHELGTGHEWSREAAIAAGRKGGTAKHKNRPADTTVAAIIPADVGPDSFSGVAEPVTNE